MKNNIREFREVHGLRQEDLAERTGVSRQTVISIEKGNYNPSIMLALKLARALDVRVEELFMLEEGDDQ